MRPIVLNNSNSNVCQQPQHTRGCVDATKVRMQGTYAEAATRGGVGPILDEPPRVHFETKVPGYQNEQRDEARENKKQPR